LKHNAPGEREDMPAPSNERALEQYRRAAPGYDRHMRRFARWQRLAVERLELKPGQTVLDVACGTGLTFPSLEAGVGPGGQIVGIDLSPEMLARAQERVDAQGWDNVALIEAWAEEAEIARADAALFSFTHDVLQSPLAVANVVAHLKPGARVASVGAKYVKGWNPVVNFFVRRSARPYVSTFEGLERPWRELENYITDLDVRPLALGGAYVARARIRDEAPSKAAERLQSMRGHAS
jgi:ubiquinone/menaquinone biosynthesis C-methylase UbiE